MIHYIYKTTSKSGKFYIGRHSTLNPADNYCGSGTWVKQIKDKSTLKVEILEYAQSFEELLLLEEKYINDHINHPNNMNFNNSSMGWATGGRNPGTTEKAKERKRLARKGKTYIELFGEETASIAKEKISNSQKGRTRDSSWNTGLTKETSDSIAIMAEKKKGAIPWNKGIETGIKTFTGAKHTEESIQQMKAIQSSNRLKYRITCEHCGKTLDKPNYSRYHGSKCKMLPELGIL